ncbi:pyridoxal phosphate-dependent class II aminotransferase [Sphingomonas populi]|uniref:Pyridoxal phosphate-dependent class II aminotransferase n=1 Tax=Sphingomonas populi TaxID=2484750 RepID=A0A4Q6Y8S8_9SPHN|nr:threonine-phosphate decarboxylase [Sphingomonas populi]RZF66117.1 pyridoxal phosphate-dependent class II aminotransferase [Sphingomonas populi]
MSWTHHGGRLADARAAFGDTGAEWLDLSTGINPHPWPGVSGLAIDWARLPDEGELRTLETTAAAYFGVDRDYVAALPGTEIGLRLLGTVLPGPARHLAPTYRTHAEMFAGSVAIDTLSVASEGMVIVANPNNPDGRFRSAHNLLAAHDRLSARDGWLVVDEAFADAGTDAPTSIAAHVADDARLIVFRSFGKFFGLAGVRLGFMIAPRGVIARVRALLGAWPVSAAAIAIGTAAYRDADWIMTMRAQLARDAADLDAMLLRRGLVPVGACPLFRLIDVPDAGATFAQLARHAILTRPFDYDPRWLRLGLPGSAAALERLERALADG